MKQAPQERVDDRYEVLGELGRGGVGTVYRARESGTGREVALKLLPRGRSDERRRERFRREGEASAALIHPGIVRVHAAGEWKQQPYLVYELVRGARTLDTVLRELELERRLELIKEAAEALGYAHQQGVVHRDVKPGNVLVDLEGHARVTDFGLAITKEADRLTKTGEIVGTPSYMAPELLTGQVGGETPATDVWALGVMLYEALCDELPFEGANFVQLAGSIASGTPIPPSHVRAAIDPGLEAICLKALEADPAARYPDGAAFAAALADPASQRPSRLRPALVGGVLGVLLAGFALSALIASRPTGAPAPVPVEPAQSQREVPASSGVSLDLVLDNDSEVKRLEGLERWLAEAPADDPRRAEAQSERQRLAFDLPLARLDDLGAMLGARFVDEDTLCVLTPEPGLWRFDGERLNQVAALQTQPQESAELLVRPGSTVCDVLLHVRNEPGRILRDRFLTDVFEDRKECFRFDHGRDLLLGFQTHRRGIGSQPLPAGISAVTSEQSVFAVVNEKPKASEVQLIRVPAGSKPETVWTRLFPNMDITSLTLSPQGAYLAVGVRDPVELILVDARTGQQVWGSKLGSDLGCLAFSPDERWLAAGSAAEIIFLLAVPGDGSHRILERARKLPLDRVARRSHSATVRSVAFSPDSRTLISCSARNSKRAEENELRFWDVDSGADLDTWFRRHLPKSPFWLSVSPSGRRLALGGRFDWLELRRLTPLER